MKGRQIAKELGLDKSQVNSFLHKNQDTFVKNSNHEWSLIRAHHVEIDFATGWIDDKAFESAIGKLAYHNDATKVTFKFGIDCKFLLIALARFLALANQLTANGKNVVIDTTACPNTHSFSAEMASLIILIKESLVFLKGPFCQLLKLIGIIAIPWSN